MTEYDNLEQELTANLAAIKDKPCGCHESTDNPFSSDDAFASDDLMGELQLALGSLGTGDEMEPLTAEEALEFASVGGASTSLENVISILEQNPGLKITFSL